MAMTGSFYGATGNAWIKPKITWTAQANMEENYSEVTATLYYTRTNSGYTTYGHWGGSLTINDNTKQSSGIYLQITDGGETAAITHTVRVPHGEDGTKTITISATGSISDTTLTYTSISGQVSLEAIPRASAISATDADIGAVSMVTVGRRSDQYTHTVAYQFGSLRGYLTANGTSGSAVKLTQTSIPFTLPEDFYQQIPNAPTGVCTLTCTTYRGNEVIGSARQTSFTVRVNPEKCGPTLSAQVADTNSVTTALTGNSAKAVRYASRMLCSMSCAGRFGASVVEKKIAGVTVTDSLMMDAIEEDRVVFSVRDSRGYVAQQTVTMEMIPYHLPTGRLTAARTDATSGKVDIQSQGSWFSGSFGKQNNALQARCRVGEGTWQTLSVQTDGDSYRLSAQLTGLSYTDAHRITLEISDRITTITLGAQINPGIPAFDWGKEDFCFHVPVQAPKVTGLAAPAGNADAVNKSYVDEKAASLTKQIDTKVSMTLLWENASPTSEFAAQMIPIDLQDYDAVEICFRSSNTETGLDTVRTKLGNTMRHYSISVPTSGSYACGAYIREANILAEGIDFTDTRYKRTNVTTAASTINTVHIPLYIYGIKGGLT